jgi:hypothetical protein
MSLERIKSLEREVIQQQDYIIDFHNRVDALVDGLLDYMDGVTVLLQAIADHLQVNTEGYVKQHEEMKKKIETVKDDPKLYT